MKPPTAARPEPMAKVAAMVRLILMPMSLDVSKSLETARMAMPIFVLLTIYSSAPTRITMAITVKNARRWMRRPPITTMSCRKGMEGKDFATPPNITVARFSNRYDMPTAEISTDVLGAERRGR